MRTAPGAFELPARLEASAPPEQRDAVRLMVARRFEGTIEHACFRDLPEFLAGGDLLVVNNSATVPAAIPARAGGGEDFELRFAGPAPGMTGGDWWVVELRSDGGARPHLTARGDERLELPGGATVSIVAPHAGGRRLWLARIRAAEPVAEYLWRYGHPVRYGYVADAWPLEAFQTVYGIEPGSAEMPSAARPFTGDLVAELVARGVSSGPDHPSHRALLPGARRGAARRALRRSRGRPRGW